jgi:integrase
MARSAKGDGSIFQTETGWRGYVTVNGKRVSFRAKSKAEASQKKRELINRRDTVGIATDNTHTVGSWIKHWLDATEGAHAASTHHGYKYLVDHYMSKTLLATSLSKINAERIEAEYRRLAKTGLAGSTMRQIHSVLHTSLKVAQQRGYIPFNPASIVLEKPKRERPEITTLHEADIAAIEAVLQTHQLKARWHIGLALGLRPGEALGLEWKHIDFDNRRILVRQQIQQVGNEQIFRTGTKTQAGWRDIPMPDYIAEMLKEHRIHQLQHVAGEGVEMWSPDGKTHSWVFTSQRRPGRPLTHNGDATEWRKILQQAGVPHVPRYAARHTAASFLVANNVDIATVAAILGHTDAGFTLKTYVHAMDERMKAVGDLLQNNKVPDKVPGESAA